MTTAGPLLALRATIAAAAVFLYLQPLATPLGMAAGVAGTLAGYALARAGARRGLRLPAGLVIAVAAIAGGWLVERWILAHAPGGGTGSAIQAADAVFYGFVCFGAFFGVCMLGQRARVFSVIELAAVVGAVAHTFAAHRHHHIHEPRFLSDWAWSHGIDPTLILASAGVVAIVLAAVTLVRTRHTAKLVITLLFLILGGAAALLLTRNVRIDNDADTNGLGLAKDDKDDKGDKDDDKNGDGSSSSRNKPPDPVAVAVLHDDLPDADVLYFRQAVLSRFNVDRLVEDTSGQFDRDLIGAFPVGAEALRAAAAPQSPAFHRLIHTSMYLLVDHAQPVGIGNPVELSALENPDPRRFVVAYDVDSMFMVRDVGRLIGRTAMPATWTDAERRHYTEIPPDPRYVALSDKLVRDVDPRFVNDDLMKAFAIKRYLEKEGFYSLKQKKLVGADPTAKFLFGDLRGYCVHFAHAAVFLLRSQGIPARVALGYGVQTSRRGAGSAVLIFGNEAHAWPELYVDGVGWVTFDIYPERSDEPPPVPFDEDLQSALGELARKDKTGGKAADPDAGLVIPWGAIGGGAAALVVAILAGAYAVKGVRRVRRASHRLVYRGVLDRLSDAGLARRYGETRERHAARLAALSPSFAALTLEHLRLSLGAADGPGGLPRVRELARRTRVELKQSTPFFGRVWAAANPIGWVFTR